MIVRSRLLWPAAIALALVVAAPAAFADDMSKDSMSKDKGMKKETMSKDGMSKDNMSKDTMSKDKMSKWSLARLRCAGSPMRPGASGPPVPTLRGSRAHLAVKTPHGAREIQATTWEARFRAATTLNFSHLATN